jgi:formate hydrogenlyase subunit 3/multisubunit Na+/H+ antiporter MnhD subunit
MLLEFLSDVKFAAFTCPIKMLLLALSILGILIFIGFWVFNKLPESYNLGAFVLTLGAMITLMSGFAWLLDLDKTCSPE